MKWNPVLAVAALSLLSAGPAVAADPAPTLTPSARQLATLCDGCRIVTAVAKEKRKGKASGIGAAGGAVAGGVVGSKVGDSTMATVGGAVVGGVVGNEIEKRVKRHDVWVVSSVGKDGSTQKTELGADPQFKAGDVVVPAGQGLKKR